MEHEQKLTEDVRRFAEEDAKTQRKLLNELEVFILLISSNSFLPFLCLDNVLERKGGVLNDLQAK